MVMMMVAVMVMMMKMIQWDVGWEGERKLMLTF